MSNYEKRPTQEKRVLSVLQKGKSISQINLQRYLQLLAGQPYIETNDNCVDAIADLGIANLPARIFGLKRDGWNILSETVHVKGRFGKTHYVVYKLGTPEKV